jgi:hypothetical protein
VKQVVVVLLGVYWESVEISDEFHFIAHQSNINSFFVSVIPVRVRLSPSVAAPN